MRRRVSMGPQGTPFAVLAVVSALVAAMSSCIPDVVPSPSTLPRCAGFDAGCGTSGKDDCCASDAVPGGMFDLVNDAGTDAGDPVGVSPFQLDRYEVTVGRFRAFVAGYPLDEPRSGDGASPALGPSSGWNPAWAAALPADAEALVNGLHCDQNYATWTDTPGANEDRPINCVTWYLAFAFCAWDGGRLPTQTEWQFAAAGGNAQRTYPWGPETPTAERASFGCPGSPELCMIPRVGSTPKGAGKWGQMDLAGSMSEWTLDEFGSLPMDCDGNCVQLTDGGFGRSVRGGDFAHDATELTTSYRVGQLPSPGQDYIGFRCARAQ